MPLHISPNAVEFQYPFHTFCTSTLYTLFCTPSIYTRISSSPILCSLLYSLVLHPNILPLFLWHDLFVHHIIYRATYFLPIDLAFPLIPFIDSLLHSLVYSPFSPLRIHSIDSATLSWIFSYLNNRTQCVVDELSKTHSTWSTVNMGVPQGSAVRTYIVLALCQ